MTPVERTELQAIRHDLTDAINSIHTDLKSDINDLRHQMLEMKTSLASCQARSSAREECRRPHYEEAGRYRYWFVTLIGSVIITAILTHVIGGQ